MALTEAQKRNAEKNRRYWAEREEEALKHYITEEKEYDKEIKRIYQNMLDACQKEIESFYAKYAATEGISLAEAKKRVAKHDVKAFERKAARYVKEKDFSAKANEELKLYNATMRINRLEMLKANIGLETIAGSDELERFMAGILKNRTMDELTRQAGILGKTVRNNAAKADAIVNGSFHNGTFSDRIWQYQDLMREDLGKLLQQGLIQGKGARALTKDLRKYLIGDKQGKGATYNVERLMRTELARVQTEAQKQSFIRNGFTHYEFIVNGGCCPVCQALSGKHFRVDKMMPGENAPPLHPHCRCSTAAWEDDAEYEAWLDYLEKGGTTEEWNKPKYKLKDDEGVFRTYDDRTTSGGHDIIKPRNVMKELKKSQVGIEALRFLEENHIPVIMYYGANVPKGRMGLFEAGEIYVYADNTKTISESALTVIHEATHAQINKPNTKNQELECYKNEYRHKGIVLTKNVIDDIMAMIDRLYPSLNWE